MAPGLFKGVLFGPVRDWGRPGIEILRTIVRRVRQYQLEYMTNWESVGRFVELGGRGALDAVMRRTELEKEKYEEDGELSLIERVTQNERELREDVENIRVIDETTAERIYEILIDENLLTIQDESEAGILTHAVMDHMQVEVDGQIVETMRLSAPVPEGVTLGEDNAETVVLSVSTPKSTKEKAEGRRKWWERQEAERMCRKTVVEEEDLDLLTSSEDEEEEKVLRKKGKRKRKAEEKTSLLMEDNLEDFVATSEKLELTNTQALEDTEIEEYREKKSLEESRWAQEAEKKTLEEEEDKAMNWENEQDEEEVGSQEGDMQRRIKDSRKLEELILEIEVMGYILDKLENVPRKVRDPIWRGRRNDARMILINTGDIIERGCYHDTQRHKVRGGWKVLKNERREDKEFAVVARIERAKL